VRDPIDGSKWAKSLGTVVKEGTRASNHFHRGEGRGKKSDSLLDATKNKVSGPPLGEMNPKREDDS